MPAEIGQSVNATDSTAVTGPVPRIAEPRPVGGSSSGAAAAVAAGGKSDPTPDGGPQVVVALSGGKDSTAMALRLFELEPDANYHLVCTPTGNELPEMFQHWRMLSDVLGQPLQVLTAQTHPHGLIPAIQHEGMIPNFRARWCTRKLKIYPFRDYVAALPEPVVSCVGIRADEPEREGGDYSDVPGVVVRYPLREWGWKLADVMAYLQQKGVAIPKRTDCALCFWQRLGEWWTLWRDFPEEFERGVQIEQEMGATFRSEGRDTWPADLAGLRAEFESGRIPKGADLQEDLFGASKCRVCRI